MTHAEKTESSLLQTEPLETTARLLRRGTDQQHVARGRITLT